MQLKVPAWRARANPLIFGASSCRNRIGNSVSGEAAMRDYAYVGMNLYGSAGGRKYLNATERRRGGPTYASTPLCAGGRGTALKFPIRRRFGPISWPMAMD